MSQQVNRKKTKPLTYRTILSTTRRLDQSKAYNSAVLLSVPLAVLEIMAKSLLFQYASLVATQSGYRSTTLVRKNQARRIRVSEAGKNPQSCSSRMSLTTA